MNSIRRRGSWWLRLLALVLAVCSSSADGWAQTPRCDALTKDQQQTKRVLFAAMHPYDGCDETFDRCLEKDPPHPVVLRLASDVCRHIKAGKSRNEIERLLAKRAQSMLPIGKPASFALDAATIAGDPHAPVGVVVYACARCPFCKVLVPALRREVSEGALKGKVRLYFQPFPLRDHPGSTEGGMAMLSAARLGKFWPFVIKMYERYDSFSPKVLPEWAAEVGIDRAAFEEKVVDLKTREALVAAKKEGIRNKVEATPALFVDGRRYVYELQQDVVVDVLSEAHERSRALRSKP